MLKNEPFGTETDAQINPGDTAPVPVRKMQTVLEERRSRLGSVEDPVAEEDLPNPRRLLRRTDR